MPRTGLDQQWLDRHDGTGRSTDFTLYPALGSAHPFAPRHLSTRLLKLIVNGLRNSDNPVKSLRKLRNLSTRGSTHGRNSEAKYTPPHPDGVIFAYEICGAYQTDIADTVNSFPEGVGPS